MLPKTALGRQILRRKLRVLSRRSIHTSPAAPPAHFNRTRSNMADQNIHAIGRRKEAVCRVYIRPGPESGTSTGARWATTPASALVRRSSSRHRDGHARPIRLQANLEGGGQTGQAGALRLAVARALVKMDEDYRASCAISDCSRATLARERKKPGRPKARKRFQSARDKRRAFVALTTTIRSTKHRSSSHMIPSSFEVPRSFGREER